MVEVFLLDFRKHKGVEVQGGNTRWSDPAEVGLPSATQPDQAFLRCLCPRDECNDHPGETMGEDIGLSNFNLIWICVAIFLALFLLTCLICSIHQINNTRWHCCFQLECQKSKAAYFEQFWPKTTKKSDYIPCLGSFIHALLPPAHIWPTSFGLWPAYKSTNVWWNFDVICMEYDGYAVIQKTWRLFIEYEGYI